MSGESAGGATPRGGGAHGADASGSGSANPTPDAGLKRSFLQQAQLRSVCKKITNYIRVVDYIVLSTLHQLLMSSLGDLLTMFRGVPLGLIVKAAEEEVVEEDTLQFSEVKKEEKDDAPLFVVDIYFQVPDAIEFMPSGTDFSQRIDATISDFVNMLKMVRARPPTRRSI